MFPNGLFLVVQPIDVERLTTSTSMMATPGECELEEKVERVSVSELQSSQPTSLQDTKTNKKKSLGQLTMFVYTNMSLQTSVHDHLLPKNTVPHFCFPRMRNRYKIEMRGKA